MRNEEYYTDMEQSLKMLRNATKQEWKYETTGGGCDCFQLENTEGFYLLTCDASAPITEEDYSSLSLGWYTDDNYEGTQVDSVSNRASLVEWALSERVTP